MENKIKQYNTKEVLSFLKESNAIEQVFDQDSLDQAFLAWNYLCKYSKLTKEVVLDVHKILMKNQSIPERDKGAFRIQPVWIGRREGLQWTHIPDQIDTWLLDVKTSIKIPGEDGKHIKLDHIEYERIHPFIDGNGRTGRMFMNWQRMQAGLPVLIIHADFPKEGGEQKNYYSWFK